MTIQERIAAQMRITNARRNASRKVEHANVAGPETADATSAVSVSDRLKAQSRMVNARRNESNAAVIESGSDETESAKVNDVQQRIADRIAKQKAAFNSNAMHRIARIPASSDVKMSELMAEYQAFCAKLKIEFSAGVDQQAESESSYAVTTPAESVDAVPAAEEPLANGISAGEETVVLKKRTRKSKSSDAAAEPAAE